MKKLILLTCLSLFGLAAWAQTPNPKYDSVLAKKYGADEYGMKPYVLVILKTGSNTSADKAARDSAFTGHMANIKRLVTQGKLIIAGPLEKNGNNYRGIFIFDVPTVEEAEKLVATDPAVKAKYLDAELYGWYASAALKAYLEASDKVGKLRF